jgi:hypothetical protein
MLVRSRTPLPFPDQDTRRRGAVVGWVLVGGVALLFVFTLAVYTISQRHVQVELQNAVDSTTLAAAVALNDDYLLTDYPDRFDRVARRALKAAQTYAGHNRVAALPFELHGPFTNHPGDELLFGRLTDRHSKCFEYEPSALLEFNAVRVAVQRRGVGATATAYVDRDVIGFKPQGLKPLPLAPLAVLTDPQRQNPRSWDHQILERHGTFHWFVDRRTGRPQNIRQGSFDWFEDPETDPPPTDPRGRRHQDDNIPEMKVVFSAEGTDDNGRVAVIGAGSPAQLKRQVQSGLTREDLEAVGGRLVLQGGGADTVNRLVLPRLKHLSAADMRNLYEALQYLVFTGERRIWLLYSRIDSDTVQGQGTDLGSMLVLGFVSAQVMHVEQSTDAGPPQLWVIIQPSMKITETAVTNARRRHLGPRTIHNPYISKVRIVD